MDDPSNAIAWVIKASKGGDFINRQAALCTVTVFELINELEAVKAESEAPAGDENSKPVRQHNRRMRNLEALLGCLRGPPQELHALFKQAPAEPDPASVQHPAPQPTNLPTVTAAAPGEGQVPRTPTSSSSRRGVTFRKPVSDTTLFDRDVAIRPLSQDVASGGPEADATGAAGGIAASPASTLEMKAQQATDAAQRDKAAAEKERAWLTRTANQSTTTQKRKREGPESDESSDELSPNELMRDQFDNWYSDLRRQTFKAVMADLNQGGGRHFTNPPLTHWTLTKFLTMFQRAVKQDSQYASSVSPNSHIKQIVNQVTEALNDTTQADRFKTTFAQAEPAGV